MKIDMVLNGTELLLTCPNSEEQKESVIAECKHIISELISTVALAYSKIINNMSKYFALRKLPKEKIILCECDGLLMRHLFDELFGRGGYKILYNYNLQLEREWGWTIDEPIPDKDIIKEWFFCEPERIITTCWDYERTLKAVEDAQIDNVRVYEFCKYKPITDLPF